MNASTPLLHPTTSRDSMAQAWPSPNLLPVTPEHADVLIPIGPLRQFIVEQQQSPIPVDHNSYARRWRGLLSMTGISVFIYAASTIVSHVQSDQNGVSLLIVAGAVVIGLFALYLASKIFFYIHCCEIRHATQQLSSMLAIDDATNAPHPHLPLRVLRQRWQTTVGAALTRDNRKRHPNHNVAQLYEQFTQLLNQHIAQNSLQSV